MIAAKALIYQLTAWLLVFLGTRWMPHAVPQLEILPLALLQGLIAAGLAALFRAEKWWLAIHILFSPLLFLTLSLNLSPHWFLAGFAFLSVTYWPTFRTRVPLYLSNATTTQALLALLPELPQQFVDLGCGTGGLLQRLALARPDCHFIGIESAPLPWLIAHIRCATLPNCTILRGDLWHLKLNQADWVYCFLSPVPMPAMEQKARQEMQQGAHLISNSFPLPTSPQQVLELEDSRHTQLFIYQF